MASSSAKPYDLEITIISGKHLKNVNWRNGILKPYCIFCVDPDRWLSTKSDESGSTKPVWNEKFTLPLPSPPQDSHLTLEIFHSKPSETPKPLVGTLSLNLRDLFVFSSEEDDSLLTHLKSFDLRRPSGRPHGQVRLKLALRHRAVPNYPQNTPTPPTITPHQPNSSYYYSSAAPPRDYRGYGSSSSIHEAPAHSQNPYHYGSGGGGGYGNYYQGYYPQQAPPPQPPRPVFERQASYLGPGPSAPVDRPVFERQASYGGPSAPVDRPLFERQASYGGSGPSAPVDRPVFERQTSYGGPSAPVDYMTYDHKRGGGSKAGWGSTLGVGAVAGAFGGLALDEGTKYEDDKLSERVESEGVAKEGYGNYHVDY